MHHHHWTNWGGNQHTHPADVLFPATEAQSVNEEEKKAALQDRENMIVEGVYDAHKEGELAADKRDLRRVMALDARVDVMDHLNPALRSH